MKVKPWSFSSLDLFTTCPRKYYEQTITKSYVEPETEAQRQGIYVHKCFEDRIKFGRTLPLELAHHEPLMIEIENMGGKIQCERKVAINRDLKPTGFFAPDVWWRGVIDLQVTRPDGRMRILDYKNGKVRPKPRQLHLFSLYGFIEGAEVVESMFYWLVDGSRTTINMPRAQMGRILEDLLPDLTAYREAFRTDQWPPKRNGLCRNYCPVVDCEFHGEGAYGR